ncbi:MAG: STAS domain-containing protein, partial [Desulfobacterota bacterium]|nr:STAS domain-containing protein [Thermodesulfobacteriota bacterium]
MVDSLYHVRGEDGRIVLEGLITGAASGSLGDAYSTSGTGAEVVLDCAGIEHVDVFGLNELIKLWLRARAQGRVLRATGVSKELMDVFRATRTDGAFSPQP